MLEKQAIQRRRRTGGTAETETDPLLLPISLTTFQRRWIFVLCWFTVFRAAFYGLVSGGLNAAVEVLTTAYLPARPAPPPPPPSSLLVRAAFASAAPEHTPAPRLRLPPACTCGTASLLPALRCTACFARPRRISLAWHAASLHPSRACAAHSLAR